MILHHVLNMHVAKAEAKIRSTGKLAILLGAFYALLAHDCDLEYAVLAAITVLGPLINDNQSIG